MRPASEVEIVEIALQLPPSCRLRGAEIDDECVDQGRYPVAPNRLQLEVVDSHSGYPMVLTVFPPDNIWVAGRLYGQRQVLAQGRPGNRHGIVFQYRCIVQVPAGGLV